MLYGLPYVLRVLMISVWLPAEFNSNKRNVLNLKECALGVLCPTECSKLRTDTNWFLAVKWLSCTCLGKLYYPEIWLAHMVNIVAASTGQSVKWVESTTVHPCMQWAVAYGHHATTQGELIQWLSFAVTHAVGVVSMVSQVNTVDRYRGSNASNLRWSCGVSNVLAFHLSTPQKLM